MPSSHCRCGRRQRWKWGIMVLSHWPHVAEQVPQKVAELVAELVSSVNGSIEKHGHILGHKLLNLLSNMWPVWKHHKSADDVDCELRYRTDQQVRIYLLQMLRLWRHLHRLSANEGAIYRGPRAYLHGSWLSHLVNASNHLEFEVSYAPFP